MEKFNRTNQPPGFYTYAYLRESDNTPWYIGKGKGPRAWERHGSQAKPWRPPASSQILILKWNLTEQNAWDHERYLISIYGLGSEGGLLSANHHPGGAGGITPLGIIAKQIGIAGHLKLCPVIYGAMSVAEHEAMDTWIKYKSGRTAADYVEFVASGSVKDQSKRAEAWAKRVDLTVDEWLAYTDRERSNIQRRYGKGVRGPMLFKNQTQWMNERKSLTRRINTALRLGVDVDRYLLLNYRQRQNVSDRYRRGWRCEELLNGCV